MGAICCGSGEFTVEDQGPVVRQMINANPGLNVIEVVIPLVKKWFLFLLVLFCGVLRSVKVKTEGQKL